MRDKEAEIGVLLWRRYMVSWPRERGKRKIARGKERGVRKEEREEKRKRRRDIQLIKFTYSLVVDINLSLHLTSMAPSHLVIM